MFQVGQSLIGRAGLWLYEGIEDCINRGVSFQDMRRTVLQAWSDIWQEKATLAAKDAANSWPK